MRSRYQINVQFVANVLDCLFVEGHTNSTGGVELIIISLAFFGIRPHQVTQQPVIRNVVGLFGFPQRIQTCNFLTDTTVHTQNLFVDQRTNREVLKSLTELFPNFQTVLVESSLT